MHRQMNTWWRRSMVCLSADQFAENHLGERWSRRETIEARSTKWNFDVEMDSGIPGLTLEPRRDEGMPTATAPMEIPTVTSTCTSARKTRIRDASSQQQRRRRWRTAKTKMVICDPSYMNLVKMKVIGKVVRYTNILETPIPKLLNEDGKMIDTGQIIITQKLQVLKNDINATMVSWRHCVTSKDRYITFVSTVTVIAVTYLGFEYPKCTRW